MENFECHIGTKFSGKPATLNDRPKRTASFNCHNDQIRGTPEYICRQRKTQLLADYHAPARRRTGTAAGRNPATRHLGALLPTASHRKRYAVG